MVSVTLNLRSNKQNVAPVSPRKWKDNTANEWLYMALLTRCRRDFAPPPGDFPPRASEIPSDLPLPGARSLGISPPLRDLATLKFRDFVPPPASSVFEVLISYTLLGSKTTAKRSAISIHAPIIRDVVNATHL